MKFSRGMMILSVLVILTISACSMISSPLKEAEKLTETADMKSAKDNKKGAIADYKKAITLYEQIVAKDPKSQDALKAQLAMGKIYHDKLEQGETARKTYQKVVDSAPKTEHAKEAMWRIAVNYFSGKKYEKAASVYNKIVNRFPISDRGKDAQLMLAKTYEKAEKYEKAAEVYDQFANHYPDDKYAAVALQKKARILRDKLKNENEAIKAEQRIVRQFGKNKTASKMVEDAKKRLQEAGAEIPEPEEEIKTQRDKALERQQERREKSRPDVELSPAMTAMKSAEKGKEETQANKYFGVKADDIIRGYQISVDSQGTVYDAMFMIADMLYASKQYKKAGALYDSAIKKSLQDNKKPDPRNYKKLADCYRQIGFDEIAMNVLKKGVRRDPAIIDSIIVSGEAQHAAGEYDKAIETYKSVIGLSRSKDADLYYHIGRVHRAKANNLEKDAKKLPEGEKAERLKKRVKKERIKELELIEKSVGMRPNDKELLQELAVTLYHSLGLKDEAYIFDRLAKDDDTNRYDVQKGLADLCYKYGNYNWAKIKYRTTIRVCENKQRKLKKKKEIEEYNQYILLMKVQLAVTEAQKGNLDKAQQSLDKLAKEKPDHAYIHYGNGQVALINGDTETGIAKLKKALELDTSLDYAAIVLKNYYVEQGNTDKAIKVLETFVEKNSYNKMMKLRLQSLKFSKV